MKEGLFLNFEEKKAFKFFKTDRVIEGQKSYLLAAPKHFSQSRNLTIEKLQVQLTLKSTAGLM